MSFGTGVFDTPGRGNGGEGAEVNDVYAAKHEDEFEAVEVTLFGGGRSRHREQGAQLLDGQRTFARLFRNDFELAERIAGDYLIIERIIEHGTDISEVDIASVARWGGLREPSVKGTKPLHGDVLECESIKTIIKVHANTRKGCAIDTLCAGRAASHKGVEPGEESYTLLFGRFGIEFGKDTVLDVASAKSSQFPGRGEPEQNCVHGDFLFGKQGVELLLARMSDHDLPPCIPLGGQDRKIGREQGADTFKSENEFEGSRRAGSGVAAVKIKASCYHKP